MKAGIREGVPRQGLRRADCSLQSSESHCDLSLGADLSRHRAGLLANSWPGSKREDASLKIRAARLPHRGIPPSSTSGEVHRG